MKFQKLTIHNIASIEDAVIDFEAEPLSNSEVFLITGKTGAGKSTILDAICLALYADTPRLDNSKMEGETQEDIKITDPRQLMRKNTTEAKVSLSFTSNNGKHYLATWGVQRTKKGSLKGKDWQIEDLDNKQIFEKDKDVKAVIADAIGLDFDQFCRTSMLAQGEFTRFLNSKDEEKAGILEKITGVDIYSKIGAKVYEITKEKEKMFNDANLLVNNTQTLSENDIQEKQEQINQLKEQEKSTQSNHKIALEKLEWIQTSNKIKKNIEEASAALQTTNDVLASEKFRDAEAIVKDWRSTIEARRWMTEIRSREQDKNSLERELSTWAQKYKEILCGQKSVEENINSNARSIAEIEEFLHQEEKKVNTYKEAQNISALLTSIHSGRQTISQAKVNIANENQTLKEVLTPTLEQAQSEEMKVNETIETEEVIINTVNKQLDQMGMPLLRDQQGKLIFLLNNISSAQERIDSHTTAQKMAQERANKLKAQLSSIEQMKAQAAQMGQPIHDAELEMKIRKEELEKQIDTVNKFATTLRMKLHVGDTCPICRQPIATELPHEEELKALYDGLQERFNNAEKKYKELTDALNKATASIQSETEVYNRELTAHNNDQSVAETEQKAKASCVACGISHWDNTTLSALDQLKQTSQKEKEELDLKISNGEKIEKELKERRQNLDKQRAILKNLTEKVTKAKENVAECNKRIAESQAIVQTKTKEENDASQQVRALLSENNWQINWEKSPLEFAEMLIQAAQKYHNQEQKRQELSFKLQTDKAHHESVATVIASIIQLMPSWGSYVPTTASNIDNLLNKANEIENQVTLLLAQLKSTEDSISTNQGELKNFFAQNNTLNTERLILLNRYSAEEISKEEGLLQKSRDAVTSQKSLLENEQKRYEEHQQTKPMLEETDNIDTLNAQIADYEKQIGEFREKKGAIDQELALDNEKKKQLSSLKEDADKKHADFNKWSRLNYYIGDNTGKKFRKIAQSYVLSSLIHSANRYMKTLTDRYTLKVTPGTFVISTVDAYQGYVSRATSTISGGESFLVSLSLALALSDIGENLSTDMLFIDEGFGTLSGEPLQRAINTLRSLHNQAGRRVGIISHVEELRERIPVQIQVNQEGNSSCSHINIVSENVR